MSAGIRWLDLDALMDQDPPPVQWIVRPLLARGAVTMLYGGHGVGKSLYALGLAAAVASGAPDLAGLEVTGGPVVIVDAENGERTLHERAHFANLPAGKVRAGIAHTFDLRQPAAAEELHHALQHNPPALLILDSLASLAPGLREQEVDQVGPVLDRLRNVAQATATAILLLHHTRKDGDSYRGGTAIPAAVDIAAMYARPAGAVDRDHRAIDWAHEKGGKMRLGPEPDPHHLSIAITAGRLTIDQADPPPSSPTNPAGRTPTRRDQLAAQLTTTIQARGPLAQSAALRAIGEDPASQTGRRALQQAVDRDQLTRLPNGHYQALVSHGDNGDRQEALSDCQAGTPTGMPCPDNHRPANGAHRTATPEEEAEAERLLAKYPELEGTP